MQGMCFIPLGVGDAFSALSYSSCLAIGAEGHWLLVDCPHPVRKMLREASAQCKLPIDLDHVDAVALTHLHADHSSGLESAAYYCKYVLRRKLPLLTHPKVAERLWPGHLAGSMEWSLIAPGQPAVQSFFNDYFDYRPLDAERPVQIGPFSVECRPSLHSIPTFALRIRAGSRCLGCSADTGFDPNLIEWLAAADLIVHETNHSIWHTPYEKLAALPPELRKRMRLIHYPDNFDRGASVIEPLRQGQVYQV